MGEGQPHEATPQTKAPPVMTAAVPTRRYKLPPGEGPDGTERSCRREEEPVPGGVQVQLLGPVEDHQAEHDALAETR